MKCSKPINNKHSVIKQQWYCRVVEFDMYFMTTGCCNSHDDIFALFRFLSVPFNNMHTLRCRLCNLLFMLLTTIKMWCNSHNRLLEAERNASFWKPFKWCTFFPKRSVTWMIAVSIELSMNHLQLLTLWVVGRCTWWLAVSFSIDLCFGCRRMMNDVSNIQGISNPRLVSVSTQMFTTPIKPLQASLKPLSDMGRSFVQNIVRMLVVLRAPWYSLFLL